MKKIFVDLEMQPIYDQAARRVCQSEIIEIGAVMLNEDNVRVAGYKSYVKPVFAGKISKKIRELTGITWKTLDGADGFPEAIESFSYWATRTDHDVEMYSWSSSDLIQVRDEAELRGHRPSQYMQQILDHWIDYQKIYGDMIQVNEQVALQQALILSDMKFEGRPHDALCDAENTARLYQAASVGEEYLRKAQRTQRRLQKELDCKDIFDLRLLREASA